MRKQGQQLLTATGVSDRYLMQSRQFFSYIVGRTYYISKCLQYLDSEQTRVFALTP